MESVVRPPAQCGGPWEVTGGFSVSLSGLSSASISLSPSVSVSASVFASVSPVSQLLSEPQYLPSSPHSSVGKWVQPAPCPWSLIPDPLSSKTPPRPVLGFKFLGRETAPGPQVQRVEPSLRGREASVPRSAAGEARSPRGPAGPSPAGTAFSFPGIRFWGCPQAAPSHSTHPAEERRPAYRLG